jgi:hypothetical protein
MSQVSLVQTKLPFSNHFSLYSEPQLQYYINSIPNMKDRFLIPEAIMLMLVCLSRPT